MGKGILKPFTHEGLIMSNIGNKYKVGVLAIVASAILIVGMISLGALKYFRITYEFMTVVTGSVQGLEKGAKVKIKGVTIGSVDKIFLGPDMKVTYIHMKFDPEAFARVATVKPEYAAALDNALEMKGLFKKRLAELVEQGMRCQLQYGDITGTMFIDIAFFDPKEYPPRDFELPPDHPPYLPSIPIVSIGSIITDVQKATQNLAKIDVQKLSDDLNSLLAKANNILDEKEMKETVSRINSISSNLDDLVVRMNEIFDKKRLEDTTHQIQKSLDSFNSTLASIEKLSEETRTQMKDSKIPETAERARMLMENSDATLKSINSLRDDLKRDMEQLYATLQSAKELIDALERTPNSVIYGKPGGPVVEPK